MVGSWKSRSRSIRACSSRCVELTEGGREGDVPQEVVGDTLDLADGTRGLTEGVQVGEICPLPAIVVRGRPSDDGGRKNHDATDAH